MSAFCNGIINVFEKVWASLGIIEGVNRIMSLCLKYPFLFRLGLENKSMKLFSKLAGTIDIGMFKP